MKVTPGVMIILEANPEMMIILKDNPGAMIVNLEVMMIIKVNPRSNDNIGHKSWIYL